MRVRDIVVVITGAVVLLSGAACGQLRAATSAHPRPPQLHVRGNQLVNAGGKPVLLHGVNRSGTEYACIQGYGIFDGPSNAASVRAMAAWHMNAVRLPLNEDCWLNVNTKGISRKYVGSSYRRAVMRYVRLLNRYGMDVLLNLHWNGPGKLQALGQQPMPDADHTPAFWRSLARTFKNNPYVLFDLYDEPYPDDDRNTAAAWTCWLRGGQGHEPGSHKRCPGVTYYDAKGRDTHRVFRAVGMQELVNVVRGTGAKQVIVMDGVAYSDYLNGWLSHEPRDPLHNLAASWHPYDFNPCGNSRRCWNRHIAPVARTVPLIAGETGEDDCSGQYLNRLLPWLDAHHASYLAWTWDVWYGKKCHIHRGPNGEISVIASYKGTPFPGMGVEYKQHLAALAR